MEQQGVVSRSGSVDIKGRTFYSFSIQDVDGLFRTGFDNSGLVKGQVISFDYNVDKYGNQVDMDSIKIVDAGAKKPTQQPKAGGGSGTSANAGTVVTRDSYWANKELADIYRQKIISYQAATNIATNIVTAALAAEVLVLPSKKAEKFDALLAMVTEVADNLVVTYTTAPERVDGLVKKSFTETMVEDPNYGEGVSDE